MPHTVRVAKQANSAAAVKHKITVRGGGHNWRARCECGWRGKGHAVRIEAAQEAGMHKLEARYAA